MPDSSLNLRDLFALESDPRGTADSPARWQAFRERLGSEIKTIKWPAAMPDLTARIGELFNVELPSLFILSWKKAAELQELLEESKQNPGEVKFLELAEHTLQSKHHPYVEIRLNGVPLPKRIQFTVELSAGLKGILLRIRDGAIEAIEAGSCEFDGTIKYEDLTIAQKKTAPLHLRGIGLGQAESSRNAAKGEAGLSK